VRIGEDLRRCCSATPARWQALIIPRRGCSPWWRWTALAEERAIGLQRHQFVMVPGNDDEFECTTP